MKLGQVYILKCSDGSLYTGVTSDLESRLADHQDGRYRGYTHRLRPVKLLWNSDEFEIQDAILLERQIKKWGRAKKLALIEEDWDSLKILAACKNASHYKNKPPRLRSG